MAQCTAALNDLSLQMTVPSLERRTLISSGPPAASGSGPPLWVVTDTALGAHSAPDSSTAWPEGVDVGVSWVLAPGGEILGIFLTFSESWSPYLKIGNKTYLTGYCEN